MTPRPDVLAVAHVTSEAGFGGGEAQVFLLVEGQRAAGDRPVLFCAPGSRSAEAAAARGIETVGATMRGDLDLPAALALARGFRAGGFDVAHLHTGRATWLGGLAAWMTGIPAVATRRTERRVRRNPKSRLVYGRLLRRVVAISPAVAAHLAAGGVPADRVTVIHDGVDPASLGPRAPRATVRAALGAQPEDLVVLVLAALHHGKGIDVLLEALGRLHGRRIEPWVWIAGRGPEDAALRARCSRLGLGPRVLFLGERRDTADLLHAADVLAHPARHEGMGVAVLEAMASGRPVVGSRVGGLVTSVVDGQTGLLVPPDDPEALAVALGRVLEDPSLRQRLGAAGPGRIAAEFLASQMVASYDALYRQVLNRPARSPRPA